jgi:hypothetical protein
LDIQVGHSSPFLDDGWRDSPELREIFPEVPGELRKIGLIEIVQFHLIHSIHARPAISAIGMLVGCRKILFRRERRVLPAEQALNA